MKILAWPAFSPSNGNPYIRLLYEPIREMGHEVIEFQNPWLAREHHIDVLHIHWLEQIFWQSRESLKSISICAAALLRTVDLFKRRGVKVVWTIHNIKPHEMTWRRQIVWPVLLPQYLRRVDTAITMTEVAREVVLSNFPVLRKKNVAVIPHGHYRDAYPNDIPRRAARQRLGIPNGAVVLLFFGMVRDYKNVSLLIDVFKRVADDSIHLLIAGPCRDQDLRSELLAATADELNIKVNLSDISADEVQVYMNAADLVVLPFKDILNSGSAMLALSFNRRLLVPSRGSLPELQKAVGDEWVRTYEGTFAFNVLKEGVEWLRERQSQNERLCLDQYEWANIAEKTIELYCL